MFTYTVCQAAKLRVSGLKKEVDCYHIHFIFKATLYFNVLQLWILILFHFVIMNFVYSCISSPVQLAFYEQLKFCVTSIYIILSKILFKTHFLHKLFMQARFNLINSLIFEICVLGPILYQFNYISHSVVSFPLPTIYQGSLGHTFFPLY